MCSSAERLRQLKEKASRRIDLARDELHALSRDIWTCPELAYHETRAHDRLVGFFTHEGGWHLEPHYKLRTAFRASWGPESSPRGPESSPRGPESSPRGPESSPRGPESSPRGPESSPRGPVVRVGFLCEYDALPGIGHACGHNLIAEVGAAAAVGLRGALQDAASGQDGPLPPVQVVVLGTPAEEDGGGKIDLLREGAFEGLHVVFMAHPSKEDAVCLPCVAEHDVLIKYHGKTSHASSYPWEGVNALDAAVLCYNNLSVLRQQLKPTWRVHGIIKHGGLKPNIIPAYTELEYYLRTPSRAELPLLKHKAEGCFRAAAEATGCQVQVEFARNSFDNMLRIPTLEQLYQANGTTLGMNFTVDEEVLANESGSTDFGNVTFEVPGIHPYFYIGSDALNHTEEYTEAAGDERAQFYTLRSAKALAFTALDLLLDPEQLERVNLEFTQAKHKEIEKEHALQKTTRTIKCGAS